MDILKTFLINNPRIDPFRSKGFLNRDYDMARVSIDLPYIEAVKLMAEMKKEKYLRDI